MANRTIWNARNRTYFRPTGELSPSDFSIRIAGHIVTWTRRSSGHATSHGIVRCPLGLNNARFTHRTNIAYFLEPEMQMSLHKTFLFCLLIDVPWWKRVFIWFLSMGFNLYCAFTVLSFPRGRTYGNTQNHRKSSFSSVLGS